MSSATEERDLSELLIRCASGDRAAFHDIYKRENARLFGLALRMTRSRTVAADVLHDAMLQAWQRAGQFDPLRGPAEAWLTTLVRYRAIDALRRQGREETGYEGPDEPDDQPDAVARMIVSEDGAALARCLETLDPSQRRAVTLAFMEGLSHPELAARLNSPLGTVKSWVRRGLVALKACLS